MKKLFISADIEGTAGVVNWNETEKSHADYAYFADQMTREVAAACEGAKAAGFDEVLVKDAHDSARNLNPRMLPEYAQIIRGWCSHPYCMVAGLDKSFDGVVLTGYHSAAMTDGNPLSHTMSLKIRYVKINGEIASEAMIACLTAAYEGVPVLAVCGDEALCESVRKVNPSINTVATNVGMGLGARTLHPNIALALIREAVKGAAQKEKQDMLYPLPSHFDIEISYIEHARAKGHSFYPGVTQVDATTLQFRTEDWFEALRLFHFVL